MKEKIRYYKSFGDDFVTSANQSMSVPQDYTWIKSDFASRIKSGVVYAAALVFSLFYCKGFLRVRFKNKKVFKQCRKEGYFIYCNHTQPLGDVFIPAMPVFPKRIYTVVSPANLGIPVIGKILPYLGALPIPDTLSGMKKFGDALSERISQKHCVVIYPEAHVWEYYTGIRPFPDSAFKYPVKENAPCYGLTCTYVKSKLFKRPKAYVYADGPFYPDMALPPKERTKKLHDAVYETMCKRAALSDCRYIEYKALAE